MVLVFVDISRKQGLSHIFHENQWRVIWSKKEDSHLKRTLLIHC